MNHKLTFCMFRSGTGQSEFCPCVSGSTTPPKTNKTHVQASPVHDSLRRPVATNLYGNPDDLQCTAAVAQRTRVSTGVIDKNTSQPDTFKYM